MLKKDIEKIIYDMPKFYKAELHKKCLNSDYKNSLIISFSFIKEAFSLYKYIDNFDVLYFSCESNVYYLSNVEAINSFIDMIIKEHNYTNIILIGTSKGGFASCLYGVLLSKQLRSVNFNALVFSAQTLLYPKNNFVLENSKISYDYLSLLKFAEENNEILKNLKKYGNLKEILKEKNENLKIYIIAGKNEIVDSKEALRLVEFSNVKVNFLDISSHFSLIPFTLSNIDIENMNKFKKRLILTIPDYFGLRDDEIELDKIANEMSSVVKNGNLRSLNEIFELLAQGKEISFTKDDK